MSAASLRRPVSAVTAFLTTLLLVMTGLVAAAPAHAAESTVTDAVLRWGVNDETNAAAFAPGTYNLLSAGVVPMASVTDRVTADNWKQADGAVSVLKRQTDGSYATATFAGLRTTADGTTITTGNGLNSGHVVELSGGAGTVDPASGTASLQWTGTFTVAYYSGMTRFWVKDPLLTVANGVGTVTATLGGWGTSMEDPEKFEELTPVAGVPIATLTGVEVTDAGFTVTPAYRGVTVTSPSPQTTTGADWGSFPQAFVDFQQLTGQSSYWYSSGGQADPRKPALPLTVSYSAPVAAPVITTGPAAQTVAEGAEATFSVEATGDALAYRWETSADAQTWTAIEGATAATHTVTATETASFRVVVTNAGGSATSDAALLTVTPAASEGTPIDGAQFEWAYNGYAQAGVFGPWRQWTAGTGVTVVDIPKDRIAGATNAPGTTVRGARFDGGTGTIDPETGAGTISWPDTGSYMLNAYPAEFGAPDETLSAPELTIAEDGTGELSFSVYLPEHRDIFGGGGTMPAVGPERIVLATFSSVAVEDDVISVTPDFAGRSYTPPSGLSPWASCDGAGGSWPTAWIDFLPDSVKAHYYSTSCSGLNTTKKPYPFSVFTAETDPSIAVQPVDLTIDAGGSATASVVFDGNPTPAVTWERRIDESWTAVEGAVGGRWTISNASPAIEGTYRAVVGGTASDTFTIDVNAEAPTVGTPEFYDERYAPGDTAFIGASASGMPYPSFQWQRSDDDGDTWADVADETMSSMSFEVVEGDAGARFRVIADNGVGEPVVSEQSAALRVETEPVVIVTQPLDTVAPQYPTAGAEVVQLSVEATGFPYAVQWQRWDADAEVWTDVPDAAFDHLTLSSLDETTPGTYRAVVGRGEGAIVSDEATIEVVPGRAARFATPPATERAVSAIDGEEVTLTATYRDGDRSDPEPVVTWERSTNGVDWTRVDGSHGLTLTFTASAADDGAQYRAVADNGVPGYQLTGDPAGRTATYSAAWELAVEQEAEVISTTASFEFGINASSQGAAANGACSFFVAGIADGSEESYKTVDGDVVLIKRGIGGQPIEVTRDNRCAPIDGSDGAQRILFTNGTATRAADGTVTVEWTGSFTTYAYGGIVAWWVTDPTLVIHPDGTGEIVAELDGFQSSWADPTQKTPLDAMPDSTILDLADVSIDGDVIDATPVYAGVDYYPLTDPFDPDSERRTTSAIPDSAKETNPNWGSWPQDLVDFHYRTGLSSYWHTSGLTADPNKPPLPIGLSLAAPDLDYVPFEAVTITQYPSGLDVIAGEDAVFEVVATTAGGSALTYQWQRTDDGRTWVDLEGETSSRLVIEDAQPTPEGANVYVRAVVTGSVQRVNTGYAPLVVKEAQAPVISTQPVDLVRFAGAPGNLYTSAEGFPTPSFQWETSVDGGQTWTDAAEPQSYGSLDLGTITAELDGALFRAVIENGIGDPVVTRTASVTVLTVTAPTVRLIDNSEWGYEYPFDAAAGGYVFVQGAGLPSTSERFVIGVVEAQAWAERDAAFGIADLLVSAELETQWNMVNGTFDTMGIEVLAGVLDASESYVAVVISGTEGDRSYDAATPLPLAGQEAPAVTAQPVSVAAPVTPASGDAVATFTAAAAGSPAPSIEWQRLVGDVWTAVGTGATLEVAYSAADDGARFRAVATSALGSAVSDEATLTVGERATVALADTIAIAQGEELALEAGIGGTGAVATWEVRLPGADAWTALEATTVIAADVRHGARYRVTVEGVIPQTVGGDVSSVSAVTTIALRAPEGEPLDVVDPALGGIELVAQLGSTYTLGLGAEHAGRYVGVWVHSDPVNLGWFLADAQGRISVTLPADLPAGDHRIVVVAQDGSLIGSLAVTVDGPPAAGGSGTAVLPRTGGGDATSAALLGMLLLLAGAGVFAARRRRA